MQWSDDTITKIAISVIYNYQCKSPDTFTHIYIYTWTFQQENLVNQANDDTEEFLREYTLYYSLYGY